MKKITIDELKERMDQSGANGTPFLFIVDFELSGGFFLENPTRQQEVLFQCTKEGNASSDGSCSHRTEEIGLIINPISFEAYKQKFDVVMEGLQQGNSFLANLTIQTPIEVSLTLPEIFFRSKSPYRLYVPGQFVCFSPERFVKIANGRISTNPMKGTISAEVENAEETILADTKETAEHYTIVDLLRNDLGMVASDICVERFRYIDRIRTSRQDILQVSSEVTGNLASDYPAHLGDIIFRMLPAGSISGAPKRSTTDILRHAESKPRGFYTGIFGYFDGKELDSAVLIRYIEEVEGQKYFRSGGGITINSDPNKEYEEVLEKIYLPFV